jgi:hypothetical protein
MLAAEATVGAGAKLGVVHSAPPGWSRSTAEAARSVIAPLVSVEALLGAAAFALAAVALGAVLRARHLAVALVGVVLWAAALEGCLRLIAGGGLAGRGALVAAAAAVAVAIEFRQRSRAPGRGPGITRLRSPIAGGEPAALP